MIADLSGNIHLLPGVSAEDVGRAPDSEVMQALEAARDADLCEVLIIGIPRRASDLLEGPFVTFSGDITSASLLIRAGGRRMDDVYLNELHLLAAREVS